MGIGSHFTREILHVIETAHTSEQGKDYLIKLFE